MNFLPPKLTTEEVREFERRYTCSDELAPLRDESAEHVSRHLRELAHEAIQQEGLVQEQEQAQPENPTAEPQQPVIDVAALLAEDIQPGKRMVLRKVMTIDRFVPGARQPNQPPPSSQAGRACKKQKVTDQPSTSPRDAAVQTPPQPTGGIVIREPQT